MSAVPPLRELPFTHGGRWYVACVYAATDGNDVCVYSVRAGVPTHVGSGLARRAWWPLGAWDRPLAHAAGKALGMQTRWVKR